MVKVEDYRVIILVEMIAICSNIERKKGIFSGNNSYTPENKKMFRKMFILLLKLIYIKIIADKNSEKFNQIFTHLDIIFKRIHNTFNDNPTNGAFLYQSPLNEINEYIKNITETILEKLKKIYIDQIIEKLKEEFIIINAKYNNVLETNLQLLEILKIKFDKFFQSKIKNYLKTVILEKALLIFLAKIRNISSEKICENIENKEIQELVTSNVNSILEKINN
jgi:hypothetical protein